MCANFTLDQTRVCLSVCLSVCVPHKRFLGTVEVIIVKLSTVTASDMPMHRVVIILTLTFIQGHTELNREHNKCLIISEIIQAMRITFAVKLVRLKVYNYGIASSMTLTFIQGHNYKCVSNLTTF